MKSWASVSFRSKSRCAVIRNNPVSTLLLRLQHSVKALSLDKLVISDSGTEKRRATYCSDIATVDTAELQTWCLRVRPAGRPAAKQPLSLRHSLILFSISAMSIIRPFPGFSVSLPYFLPFFPFVSKWCLLCLTFCVAANVASLCSLSPPVTTGPTVSPVAVTLLRRVLDWVQLSGLDLLWVLLEAWIRTH